MDVNDKSSFGIEVLAFTLGEEEYAIDIQQVQEIRGYGAVTTIAKAPSYVKGVVNLRGIIVPLVDMRIRFNLGTPTYDASTVVIILGFTHQTVGIVVDSVADVTTLAPEQLKPAPQVGSAVNVNSVIGFGTIEDRLLILLDIESLLSSAELSLISKIAA